VEIHDPIEQAVRAIVDLGITTRPTLEPYVASWRSRPPSEDTSDEEIELSGFLTSLHQAGVLNRNQGRALLMMLGGGRGAAPPDDPYLGKRFGSYIAEAKLGEGGMGKVYRATSVGSLEGEYVLKVFTSPQEPAALARFQRECEVMSQLDHPNIVKVFGTGQEGALPYLVLEYVEGPTLQELIDERGRFSWKSATRAVKQIALALASAHEQGVIHRDIKPSNILVARGGILKVFDFGLAKTMDSKVVSHAGEIIGSPAYMAPEQWGDHEVDHRVDLFALGVIDYLLLTGHTPFRGRTPADYSWKIQAGKFDPIETHVPEVPVAVQAVVTQLLERDRNHRPPSARAVLAELDRISRGRPPNLPRLERVDDSSVRWFLVGKQVFEVGASARADVPIEGAGAAQHHAHCERTLGGVLLRDLDAKGGTFVNDQRVHEIVLRDKDQVRFGEGDPLRFRSGNSGDRRSSRFGSQIGSDGYKTSSDEQPALTEEEAPAEVPGLLVAALLDAVHPRALLCAFEALDGLAALEQLEVSRRRLERAGVDSEDAARIQERARVTGQERVWRIADDLFRTTRENLGRSVEAWLAWWFDARQTYPQQLRPPGPRTTGRLILTSSPDASGEPTPIALEAGETWTVGRADDAEVTVDERSVSRRHLLILRLVTRFAFMDLGSRFGTTVGGARREVGLLAHGDVLGLGRARLLFEDTRRDDDSSTEAPAPPALLPVDLDTWGALVELRAANVIEALVALLDTERLADALVAAAEPYETFASVGARITAFVEAQRELALEALPAIVQEDRGPDADAWRAWLDGVRDRLPPQVEPAGWDLRGVAAAPR